MYTYDVHPGPSDKQGGRGISTYLAISCFPQPSTSYTSLLLVRCFKVFLAIVKNRV